MKWPISRIGTSVNCPVGPGFPGRLLAAAAVAAWDSPGGGLREAPEPRDTARTARAINLYASLIAAGLGSCWVCPAGWRARCVEWVGVFHGYRYDPRPHGRSRRARHPDLDGWRPAH